MLTPLKILAGAPPPATADVVVEQPSLAKHKQGQAGHVVVVPRLCTSLWQKHLTRATNFYFKLECSPVWDLGVHFEPVLIFVLLPLTSHRPNFEEQDEILDKFEGLLLGPRVLQAGDGNFRRDARELFAAARELS